MITEVRSTSSPRSPARDGCGGRQRADAQQLQDGAALSTTVDGSTERTPDQRIARAAVIGAAIGVATLFPAVFALLIVAGAGTAAAIGVALFCSFWGGLGLGGMEGAVAGFTKEERREAEAAREHVTAAVGRTARSREPARR
jgi:hypothetical protein